MANNLVIAPKVLMDLHSCLQCESRNELLVIEAYNWARANGLDITTYAGLNAALTQAKCLQCLEGKQLVQAVTAVEFQRFGVAGASTKTVRAQMAEAGQLSDHRLEALILYLKTLYWNSH